MIRGQLTPGGMVAGTILLGRAPAPIDQSISAWKGLVAARGAYGRLREQLLLSGAEQAQALPLPRPTGELRCEGGMFGHARGREPVIKQVSFDLPAGKVLGLIGPTAAGKTTLARLLVGNLVPQAGRVRLDGMDVSQWAPADRGQYIGYLPQDIELFGGSIRDNIARMAGGSQMAKGESEAVIAAAKLAKVHELIVSLPQGYETEIGHGGMQLSGGQRQRIALARALFRGPALVVLDEPNSNLDQAGLEALVGAIEALKACGTTVVLIAHQPSVVRQVDYLLVLQAGAVQMAGPRNEVLAQLTGGKKEHVSDEGAGISG